MFRLIYYLIHGCFPCGHTWIITDKIQTPIGDSKRLVATKYSFFQKCTKCGKVRCKTITIKP